MTLIDVLDLTGSWPVDNVAAAVVVDGAVVATVGATERSFHLASISKPVSSWAMLVAVEEGIIGLDDVIDPTQSPATLRHLLAHAGGYAFDGPDPITAPERKRIYSNTGIEIAASAVARSSDMAFADYLRLGVLDPLAMRSTELTGSPAHAMWSSVADLAVFMAEVHAPTLLSADMAAAAVRPHFPTLGGIVPGVGRFDTCPWGLGFEVRGDKSPHWTGTHNSAATFGHFGGAGTLMWIDPTAAHGRSVGLVALTDRPFGEWASDALRLWPQLSDAVLREVSS